MSLIAAVVSSDSSNGDHELDFTPEELAGMNLWGAAFNGCIDRVAEILAGGGDVNSFGLDGGFRGICHNGREYTTDAVWTQRALGNEVWEGTALHYACVGDEVEAAEFLISKGASCQLKLKSGVSPRMIAMENKSEELLTMFESVQGTLTLDSDKYRALQLHSEAKMAPENANRLKRMLERTEAIYGERLDEEQLHKEFSLLDPEGRGFITTKQAAAYYLDYTFPGLTPPPYEVEELVKKFSRVMDDDNMCFEEFAALVIHRFNQMG